MASSQDPFLFGEEDGDNEDHAQRQTPSSGQRSYFGWIGGRGVWGGGGGALRSTHGSDEALAGGDPAQGPARGSTFESRASSEIEGDSAAEPPHGNTSRVLPGAAPQAGASGSGTAAPGGAIGQYHGAGRAQGGGGRRRYPEEYEDEHGHVDDEDPAHPTAPLGASISSQGRSHSNWPQSYRQSMDWYSYMPSPSIPKILNPLLGHGGDPMGEAAGSVSGRGQPRFTSTPIPTRGGGGIPTRGNGAGPSAARWGPHAAAGGNAVAASYPPKPQARPRRRPGGRRTTDPDQQSWQRDMAARQQRFLLPSPSYIMPFGTPPSLGAARDHRHALHAPLLPDGHAPDSADLHEPRLQEPETPEEEKKRKAAVDAEAAEGAAGAEAKVDGEEYGPEAGVAWDDDEETYYLEASPPGCSFTQAVLNGVNVLAGVGVLSTPFALMQAGWSGLLLLLTLAAVCCFTGLVLRWCMDSQPGLETYPDIGEAAFGYLGRFFISIILYVELYACCVEFLILEGDNLGSMFPGFHIPLPYLDQLPTTTAFVLLTALCILPTVYLRDLSILSYVSAGGVLASLVVVFSVFWLGVTEVGFRLPAGPIVNPVGWPVAIGLFGFCYSGHAVFPNIYTSMSTPQRFNSVLFVSFLLCTSIYGGMAIMGFCMFGDQLQSQITLNLPPQFLSSKIAIWTTVVNPFTKYAISMTPVAFCLEELLPMNPRAPSFQSASLLIRTALVVSTVAVALLVPFFGYVMAFIGSFLSMTVSIILPCACYLRLLGKSVPLTQRVVCHLAIWFGVLCAIAGTYSSVRGIVASLSNG